MAVEAARGCGYRKIGGVYLMAPKGGIACCKMPQPLLLCPTCCTGIKQSRGWSWINPGPLFPGECSGQSEACPLSDPIAFMGDKAGLLWIGEKFYPTPHAFNAEAESLGVSRRIAKVPRGFKVGQHWVLLAHPRTILKEGVLTPGIFKVMRPTHIEKMVKQSDMEYADQYPEMKLGKDRADDAKRGIVWVGLPDDDPDHQPSKGRFNDGA